MRPKIIAKFGPQRDTARMVDSDGAFSGTGVTGGAPPEWGSPFMGILQLSFSDGKQKKRKDVLRSFPFRFMVGVFGKITSCCLPLRACGTP